MWLCPLPLLLFPIRLTVLNAISHYAIRHNKGILNGLKGSSPPDTFSVGLPHFGFMNTVTSPFAYLMWHYLKLGKLGKVLWEMCVCNPDSKIGIEKWHDCSFIKPLARPYQPLNRVPGVPKSTSVVEAGVGWDMKKTEEALRHPEEGGTTTLSSLCLLLFMAHRNWCWFSFLLFILF